MFPKNISGLLRRLLQDAVFYPSMSVGEGLRLLQAREVLAEEVQKGFD